MTVFTGVACAVTSCPFNLGEKGVSCGWLAGPGHWCRHAVYREAWEAAHELEQAQAESDQVEQVGFVGTVLRGADAQQVSFLADVDGALAPIDYGLYEGGKKR